MRKNKKSNPFKDALSKASDQIKDSHGKSRTTTPNSPSSSTSTNANNPLTSALGALNAAVNALAANGPFDLDPTDSDEIEKVKTEQPLVGWKVAGKITRYGGRYVFESLNNVRYSAYEKFSCPGHTIQIKDSTGFDITSKIYCRDIKVEEIGCGFYAHKDAKELFTTIDYINRDYTAPLLKVSLVGNVIEYDKMYRASFQIVTDVYFGHCFICAQPFSVIGVSKENIGYIVPLCDTHAMATIDKFLVVMPEDMGKLMNVNIHNELPFDLSEVP